MRRYKPQPDLVVDALDIMTMWFNQEGRCALTGKPMTLETGADTDARLDRKDTRLSYTLDNTQLCCAEITEMRRNPATRPKVEAMQRIADQRDREDDLLAAIEAA